MHRWNILKLNHGWPFHHLTCYRIHAFPCNYQETFGNATFLKVSAALAGQL